MTRRDMGLPAGSDGSGCLLTTPNETIANLVRQVADALQPPIDPRRANELQNELAAEVRKAHNRVWWMADETAPTLELVGA